MNWLEITLLVITLCLFVQCFITYGLMEHCNELRKENLKLQHEAYLRRLRAKKEPDA